MEKTAIRRAVEAVGSQSALARALAITPQAVQKWEETGRVPAERVLRVESVTGVSRHDLRPDIYPQE